MKSGKKWEKVAKSWKKWRKVRISGESWGKKGKSGKKLEKVDFFLQNGRRRPFWMTKNNFRSHFSPFQINTQLLFFEFFFKMAAGRHFGCPFWAILDDRKSLSIAFLTISDQYATFFFFFKMAASGHFVSPICAKNNRVLPLCVINGYAKYEVDPQAF